MRYEKLLARIASDDTRTAEHIAECAELRAKLEKVTEVDDKPLLYEELVELIKVTDYMLKAHETLRKKVRSVMGGEVLELWHDRAARMEREAREEGVKRGLEQGREQGIEQGLEAMMSKLRKSGIDESLLESAASEVRKTIAEGAKKQESDVS